MALNKITKIQIKTNVTVLGGNQISSVNGEAEFSNAYYKVSKISEATKTEQIVIVELYDQKGGQLLLSKNYGPLPVTLDGGNNIAQAYEALKQLPEFAGAVDV